MYEDTNKQTRKCSPVREVGAVENGGGLGPTLSSHPPVVGLVACCLSLHLHSDAIKAGLSILMNGGGSEAREAERLAQGHTAGSGWWSQVAIQSHPAPGLCSVHLEPWHRKPTRQGPRGGKEPEVVREGSWSTEAHQESERVWELEDKDLECHTLEYVLCCCGRLL